MTEQEYYELLREALRAIPAQTTLSPTNVKPFTQSVLLYFDLYDEYYEED